MRKDAKVVWSDAEGDKRKNKKSLNDHLPVDENSLCLELRRLKSGKGREVIEITALPPNQSWCKKLAKDLKKSLAVGGTYKNHVLEVHTGQVEKVKELLDKMSIKSKKIGG